MVSSREDNQLDNVVSSGAGGASQASSARGACAVARSRLLNSFGRLLRRVVGTQRVQKWVITSLKDEQSDNLECLSEFNRGLIDAVFSAGGTAAQTAALQRVFEHANRLGLGLDPTLGAVPDATIDFCARMLRESDADQRDALMAKLPDLFIAERRPKFVYGDPRHFLDRIGVAPTLALDLKVFRHNATRVINERRTLLGMPRLFVLWQSIYSVRSLELPMVEVGVYRGGSAWFIATATKHFMRTRPPVYAIDTFAGHPNDVLDQTLDAAHPAGLFGDVDVDDVRAFLAERPNVRLIQGEAVGELQRLNETAFSFVHLDVDTYLTTKRCLEYFVPRLAPGAILVIDDFGAPKCRGLTQAVNEALAQFDTCHTFQLSTEQLLLIKRDAGSAQTAAK